MKRVLVILILWPVLTVLSSAELAVDPQVFDFGTVEEGDTVMATFSLKNSGSAPILFKSIKTSCGCATVSKRPDELPAGGAYDLKVKFRTTGYRGDVTKYVYIYTNQSFNRTALTIKGKIRPQPAGELKIGQARIDLGTFRPGDDLTREVKVLNSGQKALEIIEVTHPPFFQVRVKKIILEPGESTVMTIRVLSTIHGGGMKFIRLKADTPSRQYQWVRISYNVK